MLLLLFIIIINNFKIPIIFRDFLPRGSGIVTRRPLILQLINSNTGKLQNSVFYTVKAIVNNLLSILIFLDIFFFKNFDPKK